MHGARGWPMRSESWPWYVMLLRSELKVARLRSAGRERLEQTSWHGARELVNEVRVLAVTCDVAEGRSAGRVAPGE